MNHIMNNIKSIDIRLAIRTSEHNKLIIYNFFLRKFNIKIPVKNYHWDINYPENGNFWFLEKSGYKADRNRFIFVNNKMLKTFTMDGSWQKISLDILWVDTTNMADYITAQDNANKISDSYGQVKSGLCISTDPANIDYIYVAEWEDADPADCIALGVGGSMTRPFSSVKALNELRVNGTSGDKAYVQAL